MNDENCKLHVKILKRALYERIVISNNDIDSSREICFKDDDLAYVGYFTCTECWPTHKHTYHYVYLISLSPVSAF